MSASPQALPLSRVARTGLGPVARIGSLLAGEADARRAAFREAEPA